MLKNKMIFKILNNLFGETRLFQKILLAYLAKRRNNYVTESKGF